MKTAALVQTRRAEPGARLNWYCMCTVLDWSLTAAWKNKQSVPCWIAHEDLQL